MSYILFIPEGEKYYFNNEGELHREDGPAVISEFSNEWYINGEAHRLDGPAVEWSDGTKEWAVNGLTHRLDGPAFEWNNGIKEWWINGVRLSPEKEKLLNIWYSSNNK